MPNDFSSALAQRNEFISGELGKLPSDSNLLPLIRDSFTKTEICAAIIVAIREIQSDIEDLLVKSAERSANNQSRLGNRLQSAVDETPKKLLKLVESQEITNSKLQIIKVKAFQESCRLIDLAIRFFEDNLSELFTTDNFVEKSRKAFIKAMMVGFGRAAVGKVLFLEIPLIFVEAIKESKEAKKYWTKTRDSMNAYEELFKKYNRACDAWNKYSQVMAYQLADFRRELGREQVPPVNGFLSDAKIVPPLVRAMLQAFAKPVDLSSSRPV